MYADGTISWQRQYGEEFEVPQKLDSEGAERQFTRLGVSYQMQDPNFKL